MGDMNLRDEEEDLCTVGWTDMWTYAGKCASNEKTWNGKYRYDRIFFHADLKGGNNISEKDREDSVSYEESSFVTQSIAFSDHARIAGELNVRPGIKDVDTASRVNKLLRAGATPRKGFAGVCRRPGKHDKCAKLEPKMASQSEDQYYCAKDFEKPRIPPGAAVLIEDSHRRGLWRLYLPRNQQQINSHLPDICVVLGANSDAQIVASLKGARDYVAKYISKYGAGQTVNSRIASILDEIVSKTPEGHTMTISSLLSKAFIATAVPDAICSAEAWHILFGLDRTLCSRTFSPLNLDASKTMRMLSSPGHDQEQPSDSANGKKRKRQTTNLLRRTPVERYLYRMNSCMSATVTLQHLEACSLHKFVAEYEDKQGKLWKRKQSRIVKVKPYLNLDMSLPGAPNMARLALRAYRSFTIDSADPIRLQDDRAIEELETFINSAHCPRFLRSRYTHHNRPRCRNRSDNKNLTRDRSTPNQKQENTSDVLSDEHTRNVKWAINALAADIAREHDLRWHDEDTPHFLEAPALSVMDVLRKNAVRKTPMAVLRPMYRKITGESDKAMKSMKALELRCEFVKILLGLDLVPYVAQGKGRPWAKLVFKIS